jgi:capsular polysaccharide biosynthesis protein
VVIILVDWLKNRWVIIVILFVIAATAATVFMILLSKPHHQTFTNAWYV